MYDINYDKQQEKQLVFFKPDFKANVPCDLA